ncbi:KRF1 protein, partial [Psophia crepitans]|nr:KRF1 protein [Psophia crepitans]
GTTPLANSCNEPCVRQASLMVVTLPRPILSSFSQNTVVGSSTFAVIGSTLSCDGLPITSGDSDLPGVSNHNGGRSCLPC